jgi:hypothetical protein
MPKPLGLTSLFQIVHPSRAQDQIWDAVTEARSENMTVVQVISEIREAWSQQLRDEAKAVESGT